MKRRVMKACRAANWGKLSLVAACALVIVACGKADQPAPASVSATTAPAATSTAAPVAYVTLPDTYGQNAETAKATLEGLGLTNVELSSSNTENSTVEIAKDWKVIGMQPGAGTVVKSDQPVIVSVVKVG